MSERTFHERPVVIRGYKYIRLKSGRLLTFWDAIEAADRADTDLVRAVSRALKLATHDWDLERIEWFIDGLESWIGAVRGELEKRRGTKTQEERIALLRNTTGRTPEEAEAFRRKADELEARLPEGVR